MEKIEIVGTKPTELERVLMERDGLDAETAQVMLDEARIAVLKGAHPEEVLEEWFGLELDYVFDLMP